MHSLFGTHGSTLLPLFDQLLPTFAGMLVSQNCIDRVHEFSSFISGYNSCIYLIRQLHFMIQLLHISWFKSCISWFISCISWFNSTFFQDSVSCSGAIIHLIIDSTTGQEFSNCTLLHFMASLKPEPNQKWSSNYCSDLEQVAQLSPEFMDSTTVWVLIGCWFH